MACSVFKFNDCVIHFMHMLFASHLTEHFHFAERVWNLLQTQPLNKFLDRTDRRLVQLQEMSYGNFDGSAFV